MEKIKIEQRMSMEELIIYLEDTANSLKQGRLVVQRGEEFVDLKPGKVFDVEVKAKHKDDKVEFKIEFSWLPGEDELDDEELKISSVAPEESAEGAGESGAKSEEND